MKPEDVLGFCGGACALVAAVAWIADRRRLHRADLNRVGWVPWTALFFWALLGAVVMLGLAAKLWLAD